MEQCGAKGRVRSMRGWREEGEVSTPIHPHSKSMMPTGHHRLENSARISVSLFESPSVRGWVMDEPTTVRLSNCPSAQALKGLTTQPPVVPPITSKGETHFKKNSQRSNTPRVDPNTSLKAAHRLAHLVRREGLMTLEGIRIETSLVELVRALKCRHGLVMLALQREAVAHRDPRLGCLGIDIEHLLCEPRKRRRALKVPEERRVVV